MVNQFGIVLNIPEVRLGLYPFGSIGLAAPSLNRERPIKVKNTNLKDGRFVLTPLENCSFFFSSFVSLFSLTVNVVRCEDFLFFHSYFLRLWKDFFFLG